MPGGIERRIRRLEQTVDNHYFTESEAAKHLGVGRRTLQRWRMTGEGPPYKRLGPKFIRYSVSDCEKWTKSRTFTDRPTERESLVNAQ